ncbi:MAG TPA: hypothetical protein VJJ26_02060 [Candidatus Babeliales bacterium]|nr:hypothetical protein [Candidatus Babeliales bacterium]
MKNKYVGLLAVVIGVCTACSVGQEFIKPKTKRVYVSKQQDAELDGDLVARGTDMSGVLLDLSKTVFLIIQSAITRVNEYACGEKNCLGKVERTDCYEKKMKIKEEIERSIDEILKILQRINDLVAALQS